MEMPFDLYKAVEHASAIIHWQENLTQDEMPPEWMWSVDHELQIWFERVQDDRDERYGGPRRADRDEVPMMSNELAKEMRRG